MENLDEIAQAIGMLFSQVPYTENETIKWHGMAKVTTELPLGAFGYFMKNNGIFSQNSSID